MTKDMYPYVAYGPVRRGDGWSGSAMAVGKQSCEEDVKKASRLLIQERSRE